MITCGAIIVAAGSSRRAGFDKLLAPLNGIPVLRHSINAFLNCPNITEIIVVCPKDRFDLIMDQTETHLPVKRVDGGSERHESVMNGIRALSSHPTLISVHDGARPLITKEQILKCIDAATKYQAASSAHPITDTLKRGDAESLTTDEVIIRENMWAMETPQIFDTQLLKYAYQMVTNNNLLVTDEVSALQYLKKPTFLVQNNTPNPKITWPQDIAIAEALQSV